MYHMSLENANTSAMKVISSIVIKLSSICFDYM